MTLTGEERLIAGERIFFKKTIYYLKKETQSVEIRENINEFPAPSNIQTGPDHVNVNCYKR